jgi:hypothetical protein
MHTFKTFIRIKGDIAVTSAVSTSEVGTAAVMGKDGDELKLECGAISVTVARTFSTLTNQKLVSYVFTIRVFVGRESSGGQFHGTNLN